MYLFVYKKTLTDRAADADSCEKCKCNRKTVRREYRLLSDEERARFHAALNALKRSGVYDVFAKQYAEAAVNGSATRGPGFLPWNRECLKR